MASSRAAGPGRGRGAARRARPLAACAAAAAAAALAARAAALLAPRAAPLGALLRSVGPAGGAAAPPRPCRGRPPLGAGRWAAAEAAAPAASEDRERELFLELGWENLDADTEEELLARFRAICSVMGGAEEGHKVVAEARQLVYYNAQFLSDSGAALKRHLGDERALEVINNNPSALTIPAKDVDEQYEQIANIADGFGFLKQFGFR